MQFPHIWMVDADSTCRCISPGFLTAAIPRMIIPLKCLFYVRWGLVVNKQFRFVLLGVHLPSRVPLWGREGFFSKLLQINFRLQGKDLFSFLRRGIPCPLYLQGIILFISRLMRAVGLMFVPSSYSSCLRSMYDITDG